MSTVDNPAERVDLWPKLRFDPAHGAVWLDEQRMVLLHTGSLGALRTELVRTLGFDRAAALLMRMGYRSGIEDAEIARKMVGDGPYEDVFLLGPRFHQLEGVVQVETVHYELDLRAGVFSGEFRWRGGWEADSHVAAFGIGDQPICWNQLGYASGYVSAFMGKRVMFRETMCRGRGDPYCTVVGAMASNLPADDPHVLALTPDDIASELQAMADEIIELRAALTHEANTGSLIGQSPPFLRAVGLLQRAADTAITVLLTGETGVGKEVFARWLHENGARRDGPFIAVNCGAIPADLIESELFGVEAGAYAGADRSREGRFARADGGTLFLDEVVDLPLPAQVKLLRILQTGELERLGAETVRQVDVRIVAATHVDLQAAVDAKQFRADLFYRLNPYPIEIPPLRERRSDIPLFVDTLLDRLGRRHRKPIRGLSDRAMSALLNHNWPGNVRELENVLERGVLLAEPGGRIDIDSLFLHYPALAAVGASVERDGHLHPMDKGSPAHPEDLTLSVHESALINEAIRRAGGNLNKAAQLLGLTRRQLDYRIKPASR